MSDPLGPWLSLDFSPNGKLLASGSYDGIIQLWDAETREAIGSPWANQMSTVKGLEFSPDGRLLLSWGDHSTLQIWEVATGEPEEWHTGETTRGRWGPMTLSSDGTRLAFVKTNLTTGAQEIYIADLETRQVLTTMINPTSNTYDLALSPDNMLLASGSSHGRVRMWDTTTGEVKGRWTLGDGEWWNSITTVAFNPDGNKLAACNRLGASDWTIWVVDLETNQTTHIEEIW
jgi:WD40 repeat protein